MFTFNMSVDAVDGNRKAGKGRCLTAVPSRNFRLPCLTAIGSMSWMEEAADCMFGLMLANHTSSS